MARLDLADAIVCAEQRLIMMVTLGVKAWREKRS